MISTVCAIVACATTLIAQDSVCRLSGSIPDESFNGKKIYIVNFDNNQPLDSAVIKNGKFAFSTKTTGTALPAALAIEGRKVASFIFEPGNLSINEKGQVLGSPLNDKNEAISANLDSLYNNYREKMRQLSRSGKPANEMMAEAEILKAKYGCTIFVTGDMNAYEDDLPIRQFLDGGYVPCYKIATDRTHTGNGHHVCSPKEGYSRRTSRRSLDREQGAIDHCFIHNAQEGVVVKAFDCVTARFTIKLTDHYPYLIDVAL